MKMESNDNAEVTKTTIEELPNELIVEILKLVDDESDLDNLQQVCRRWFSVIDERIGRIVHHPGTPNFSNQGIEAILEIGVKSLFIEAYRRPLTDTPTPLPSLKYPNILKQFHFRGHIHPDVFMSLARDAINLSEFRTSLATLFQLRNEDLAQLNFPRLKEMCVHDFGYSSPQVLAILSNLQALLQPERRFPQLARLILTFPVTSFMDLRTLHLLIAFIQRHHVLEQISVTMNFLRGFVQADVATYEEELSSIDKRNECCCSLKILRVHGGNIDGEFPHLKIWKDFAIRQSALEDIDLKVGAISNDMLQAICTRNGSTLKKLSLYQFAGDVPPEGEARRRLECSAFSSLETLQSLELFRSPELLGTRHFPSTLVQIDFSGRLRSEEAAHILLQLPNLREVQLELWEFAQEGYAVGLDTLWRVAQNRRIRSLLVNGVRDEFPLEGIPNWDPIDPVKLIVYRRQYVYWRLNRDEYYVNVRFHV